MEQNINQSFLMSLIQNHPSHLNSIKRTYLSLLSQLSECPDIPDEEFYEKIFNITQIGQIYILFINSPGDDNFKIIGSGTIIIEPKIIHNSSVGHIEDIVVHQDFRGQKLAKNVLNELKSYGSKKNVYKLILDCKQELVTFYEKNGFEFKGAQMALYYN